MRMSKLIVQKEQKEEGAWDGEQTTGAQKQVLAFGKLRGVPIVCPREPCALHICARCVHDVGCERLTRARYTFEYSCQHEAIMRREGVVHGCGCL